MVVSSLRVACALVDFQGVEVKGLFGRASGEVAVRVALSTEGGIWADSPSGGGVGRVRCELGDVEHVGGLCWLVHNCGLTEWVSPLVWTRGCRRRL